MWCLWKDVYSKTKFEKTYNEFSWYRRSDRLVVIYNRFKNRTLKYKLLFLKKIAKKIS